MHDITNSFYDEKQKKENPFLKIGTSMLHFPSIATSSAGTTTATPPYKPHRQQWQSGSL